MANRRGGNDIRVLGLARRSRTALTLTTALQAAAMLALSSPAGAQPPNTQPQGGVVVGGAATISQNATGTTISQTSQRAALNWQSFNVGSQQVVTFQQPSSSSVALNRVVGPDPSQIAGRIDANGQVVLVNQSGVVFTQGSQVNAAGLLVSAAGISTGNFMAGAMKFDQAASPNARVENRGTITIKQAGLAALVAPQVVNSGTITATLGHVVLAGAKTATLDMYGDGLVALDVTNQVTQVPVAADGTTATALVTNSGTILANGGSVQLTARAADGIVQNLVRAGGQIGATTVGTKAGTIALNAVGGSIVVEGQIAATGDAAGTSGGTVEVLASKTVGVAAGATINVSGQTGGGIAAIGTTLARARGGPSVTGARTARNVTVQQGATILADATQAGQGGRVVLLSGDTTHMDGSITARGGPQGGAGGFVEVSGTNLGLTGAIDVAAPRGTPGTILLDPNYLDIVAGASGTGSEDGNFHTNGGTVDASDGDAASPDTITTGQLESFSGANVLLEAVNSITIGASFSLPHSSLTLQVGDVQANLPGTIVVAGGVSLTASGDIVMQVAGHYPQTNFFSLISVQGAVTSTSGSVSLLTGGGGAIDVGANGSVTAASGQRVTIQTDNLTIASGPGSIVAPAGTVEIAPKNTTFLVTLAGTGGLAVTQGALSAISAATLDIGAVTLAGVLTTTAAGITIGGAATLPGSTPTLVLNTPGQVSEVAGAALTVGTLVGNAGQVELGTSTLNVVGTVGSFNVIDGDFTLALTGPTTLAGPVVANDITVTTTGVSVITVTGGLTATPAGETSVAVSLSAGAIVLDSAASVQGFFITFNGTNGITLNGNASLGLSGSVVDLSTAAGGVTEAVTATIAAEDLTSSEGVVGNVRLLGSANAVEAIEGFAVAGGSFAMTDSIGLIVDGTLSAANGNVYLEDSSADGITIGQSFGEVSTAANGRASFQTDALVVAGGAQIVTGTFELAPDTVGATMSLATGGILASLAGISSTEVRLGAVTEPDASAPATRAGAITVAGTFDFLDNVVELDASGPVDASAGVLANVASLSGTATIWTLTSPDNGVTALGNIVATSFALNDAIGLTVNGPVVASADATIVGSGTITVAGSISAPTISLQGLALSIAGAVGDAAGTVNLVAGTGGVTEDGSILAGTLTGNSTGPTSLIGSNSITTLGNFTATAFTLNDTPNLTVAGSFGVRASAGAAITDDGTLTVASGISASAIGLAAAAISIPGLVTDGGVGTVGLAATDGGISEVGTLVAANLSGSATGAAAFGGTNTVATVSNFTSAGFSLADTGNLTIGSGTLGLRGGPSVTISDTGVLTVDTVFATTVALTARALALQGVVSDIEGAAASVNLVATNGGITEAGTLTAATLTGSATGSALLNNTGNTIGTLAGFTAGTNLTLIDSGPLTVIGSVSAGSPAAPSSANVSTLALTARNGLALGIAGSTAATLNAGTISLTSTGSISEPNGTLAANDLTAQSNGTGGDILLPSATNRIAASSGLAATNGNVVLVDDPTLVLTGAYSGNNLFFEVTLPGGSLAVGGTVPATLTVPFQGRVTLVADAMTATPGSAINAPDGTLELAPFSAIPETLLGAANPGTLNIDAALLGVLLPGSIMPDTLLIGAFTDITQGHGIANEVVEASAINLSGTVALTTTVTNLGLMANGPVTEGGGVLAVDGLFGLADGGNFALNANANAIGRSEGITARSGDVALVDGIDLALIGSQSGDNLFFEVAKAGGTLSVGALSQVVQPASVQATEGGRVTLIADTLRAVPGSAIVASDGTVELAPFSPINVSLLGTAGVSSGLVLDSTLVSAISTGTLIVGGFTDAPAGFAVALIAAASVSVDGTADITGVANALVLEAIGPISEPGGPLSVAQLGGTGSSVTLLAAGNRIATVDGLVATAGNLSLADTGTLTVEGAVTASGNVYLGDAGGSVAVSADGRVTGGSAGLVSVQSDTLTLAGGATVTGGTFEYAPATLGASLVLGPAEDLSSLAGVSTGLVRLGAVTLPGATAPTTTAGAILVQGTFDATGLPVELDASGPITGDVWPLINVGVLSGSGGAWTLTAANVSVTALGAINATSFALNDSTALSVNGVVTAGSNANIAAAGLLTVSGGVSAASVGLAGTVLSIPGSVSAGNTGTVTLGAVAGDISETGTLVAGALTGSASGAASFAGANTVAALGNFTAAGLTLNDGTALSVTGEVVAGSSAAIAAAGSLSVTGSISASSVGLAGTALSIPGSVSAGTAGTVALAAIAGDISETGALIAGTLAGSATGAVALTGANEISTLSNFTSASFLLLTGLPQSSGNVGAAGDLLIAGTLSANSISIVMPSVATLTLGNGAAVITGGVAPGTGAIVAADEPANGGPGAYLQAGNFVQTGASSVTGPAAAPSTLQINATGNISFDPKLGLQAGGAWLVLNLTNGAATGNVFVKALDVSYVTPGSAALTGTINGVSGEPAATFGAIQPASNPNYTFNGCIIAAVTCAVVTPPTPPTPPAPPTPPPPTPPTPSTPTPIATNTVLNQQPVALGNLALVPLLYVLQNVTPQVLLSPQDLDDLLQLPVVSEQDY